MISKHRLSKLISVFLIGAGVYQFIYSAILVLFVYPQFFNAPQINQPLLQEGLIEKAIVYYLTMIANGAYGLALLFKPKEEVAVYHLVVGACLSVFAAFFIIRTPLTTDPLLEPILKLIKGIF